MDIKAFKLLRIHVSRKGGVDKTKIVIKGTIFFMLFFNHLKTPGSPNLEIWQKDCSRHFPLKFRRIFVAHGLKNNGGK